MIGLLVAARRLLRQEWSLRLNLTQHGETHQVNFRVYSLGLDNVIASIANLAVQHLLVQGTLVKKTSQSCDEPPRPPKRTVSSGPWERAIVRASPTGYRILILY
jgi:hypothetical protein